MDKGKLIVLDGLDGCGKSTLIKLIIGRLKPTRGVIDLGHNLQIGYYDQENQNLCETNTVLEELWSLYPDMKEHEARGALGAFLFRGDDVFKKVGVLSGGERVRCMISKLMLSGASVLLLDQPTNHLDLESIAALNNGLEAFPHNIIFSSHDHQLTQTVANRIIEINPDGSITDRMCTYDEYMDLASMEEGR